MCLIVFEWAHRGARSSLANGIAAYAMFGYGFNSLTPYIGYSYTKTLTETFKLDADQSIKDRFVPQIVGLGQVPLDDYAVRNSNSRSNTITTCLRLGFYQKMALKVQVDSFRDLKKNGEDISGSGFRSFSSSTLSASDKNIIVSTASLDIIF